MNQLANQPRVDSFRIPALLQLKMMEVTPIVPGGIVHHAVVDAAHVADLAL